MRGWHLDDPEQGDSAAAGIVIGLGWAHEPAHLRGISERTLAWLSDVPGSPGRFAVDEMTSTVLLQGTRGDVARGMDALAARLGQAPGSQDPQQLTPPGSPDAPLLNLRYGNRSFGLLAAPRRGFITADGEHMRAWLDRLGPADLATFGVNLDLPEEWFVAVGREAIEPPSTTPVVTIPGALPGGGPLGLSWIRGVDPLDDVATAVMARALAAIVPDAAPGTGGIDFVSRPVGMSGVHVAGQVNLEHSPGGLGSAVADVLQRLTDDGPTEVEVIQALDAHRRADQPAFLQLVIRETTREVSPHAVTQSPPTAQPPQLDVTPALIRDRIRVQLGTLLATGAGSGRLRTLAPQVPGPGDETDLAGGTTLRPVMGLARGELKGQTLRVGGEGISWAHRNQRSTVRAQDVVAYEVWPDGERMVISARGDGLVLDPLLWAGADKAIGELDAQFDALRVDRPDRLPPSRYVVAAVAQMGGRDFVLTIFGIIIGLIGLILVFGGIFGNDPAIELVIRSVIGVFVLGMAAMMIYLVRRTGRWRKRLRGTGADYTPAI